MENLKESDVSYLDTDSMDVSLDNALGIAKESKKNQKYLKKKESVVNMRWYLWEKDGIYSWEFDKRRECVHGNWTFLSDDGFFFDWEFDLGDFQRWTITNMKTNQEILVTDMKNSTYYWLIPGGNGLYGKWDLNMHPVECTYKGITIKLYHNNKAGNFLVNNNGDRVKIQDWIDPYNVAVKIIRYIKKVQYSWKKLDYFEADNDRVLQADYENKVWDEDLIPDCPKSVWIGAKKLANRLNRSRRDFGI